MPIDFDMAAPVKRAPLSTPKTFYDDLGRRFKNHDNNPHMEPSIIMCSGIVTSDQLYEDTIYEDPVVLPQQLNPNEDNGGKVRLTFCFAYYNLYNAILHKKN